MVLVWWIADNSPNSPNFPPANLSRYTVVYIPIHVHIDECTSVLHGYVCMSIYTWACMAICEDTWVFINGGIWVVNELRLDIKTAQTMLYHDYTTVKHWRSKKGESVFCFCIYFGPVCKRLVVFLDNWLMITTIS